VDARSGGCEPIGKEAEKCEQYRRRKMETSLDRLGRASIFDQTDLGTGRTFAPSAGSADRRIKRTPVVAATSNNIKNGFYVMKPLRF
jgi:hypothetical protein